MPKFAANLTMLFNDVPFLDRFEAAARAGFSAVEYLFPYDFDAADLAGRLRQHGLTQVLHNLPAGNWGAGERGIACHPDRVSEFKDGVARAISYARALDCPQVNCLAGIVPAGVTASAAHATFVSNLQFAAAQLGEAGIRLVIEAINTRDIPGFFLTTTKQALAVIEEVGAAPGQVAVQYDVYHMQIMEGDVIRTIRDHGHWIAHYHTAGNPGRNELDPGQELNYAGIAQAIADTGFRGWMAHEFIPTRDPRDGLRRAREICG